MSRIYEITEKVLKYYPKADIENINKAYVYSAQVHANQKRKSGEPYLNHPLAVADILVSLKLDEASIITGLLHDTVEDTAATLDEIEAQFGSSVASLVDGVTKISQIKFSSSEHKQIENYRKMLLATAKDLRVLLVKLGDRLHNMRTLHHLSKRKQLLISKETMDIYAPLAHRLGIHWIKQEMEDLSFMYLYPDAYQEISRMMSLHVENLDQTRVRLEKVLEEALNRHGLEATVQGRMKHLYSLYQKMKRKHVSFEDMYDIVAFRLIVKDVPAAYQALGIIHAIYRPVPGRFKDYIALPKPNGYQSLHTAVIGPDNYRLEVQIRTESMHQYADHGVAAHWAYKEDGSLAAPKDQKQFRWLSQLTDMIQHTDNPGELLDNVRLDLFVQEVYVFTKDGDIVALPRGAYPLDFAYAIHTNVGNHASGVKVNGQLMDFQTHLANGDQVEIVTDSAQTPERQWLQFARSSKARHAIRQWLRKQEKETSVQFGQQLLQMIYGKENSSQEVLKSKFQCKEDAQLFERVGNGSIPLQKVMSVAQSEGLIKDKKKIPGVNLSNIQPMHCCYALPGDPLLGYIGKGNILEVHHRDCSALRKAKGMLVEIGWEAGEDAHYLSAIQLKTVNRRGMLADVSGLVAKTNANIEDLRVQQMGGDMTQWQILVDVTDRKHMADVIRSLRSLDGVTQVRRQIDAAPYFHKVSEKKAGRGFANMIKNMVVKGLGRQG